MIKKIAGVLILINVVALLNVPWWIDADGQLSVVASVVGGAIITTAALTAWILILDDHDG